MNSQTSSSLSALRDLDRDRYLACLYLPVDLRQDASAIYAFGAETARIAELVSEPMPGEIRLEWWREVISLSRDHGNNQIAGELLTTIERNKLPKQVLLDYLDARIFDLYSDPMPDHATLEGYCGETASALLNLIAICAGANPDRNLADACGHAGVAITVTQLVKVTAAFRLRQRVYVPADILSAAGLNASSWLSDEPDQRHLNAVAIMIGMARDHYHEAVQAIYKLDKTFHPIFLPLATMPATLDAVEKSGLLLFKDTIQPGALRRQWLMWRGGVFGL
ncbi:MAG: phytoene/squalene synthase family protein [Rhizobiaceae bacterium]